MRGPPCYSSTPPLPITNALYVTILPSCLLHYTAVGAHAHGVSCVPLLQQGAHPREPSRAPLGLTTAVEWPGSVAGAPRHGEGALKAARWRAAPAVPPAGALLSGGHSVGAGLEGVARSRVQASVLPSGSVNVKSSGSVNGRARSDMRSTAGPRIHHCSASNVHGASGARCQPPLRSSGGFSSGGGRRACALRRPARACEAAAPGDSAAGGRVTAWPRS